MFQPFSLLPETYLLIGLAAAAVLAVMVIWTGRKNMRRAARRLTVDERQRGSLETSPSKEPK